MQVTKFAQTINMSVLKTIKMYPEVFSTQDKIYTYEEAIRLIASCESRGSDIQKASFLIQDCYSAMWKLAKMGLRQPAVEIAEKLLATCKWYQEYIIASEVCKYLVNHYMVYSDLETSDKYNEEMKIYREMADYEHEVRQINNRIIYNNTHGLPVDKEVIIENLDRIEKVLQLDSCVYHNFYFSCKIMLTEGDERELIIEDGLHYFTQAYFKHDFYIQKYLLLLSDHAISIGEHNRAYNLLAELRDDVATGSKPWFDCIRTEIRLYLKEDLTHRAAYLYEKATSHEVYQGLAELEQLEWESIRMAIYEGENIRV